MQRLRNEAEAGLAVQVEFVNLEPRSPSGRHESASNIEKTRPEKASKWIKLTERKCLEQRDRVDRSAGPETALVDDRVGECEARRFR